MQWMITADKNSAVLSLIDRISETAWKPFPCSSGESVEGGRNRAHNDRPPQAFRLLVKRVRDRSTPIGGLMIFWRYCAMATNFGPKVSVAQVLT